MVCKRFANFNKNESAVTETVLGDNAQVVQDETNFEKVSFSRVKPGNLSSSDFPRFVDHPVLIYHNTWTAVSPDVRIDDIVSNYFTTIAAAPMGKKWANMYYLSGDIKIKVVIQGQPFAAGQIVLAFTPVVGTQTCTNITKVAKTTLTNTKIVPHIIVDPSKTCTYELTLPVCTVTGYYGIHSNQKFGSYTMDIVNFNNLISGTSVAPAMGICVYMSFENPVLEGFTALLSSAFVEEKKEGGVLSTFAKNLGKYSGMMSVALPGLSPQITLFSKVSSGVGDLLGWLGYSKPPIADLSLFPLTRVVDNYSQFDGRSSAIVLGGSESTSVGISPVIAGSDPNDMLISSLCARKALIKQTYISPTDAEGVDIADITVQPMLCINDGSSTSFQLTPIAGVAMPFTYWTGDLTYTIEVVASVFHRATLLISWDPSPSVAAVPTVDFALSVLQNVTMTISGNTSLEVTIPYKQPTPWLTVFGRPTDDYSVPGNGTLYIHVINPVTSNDSTDSLPINIYLHSNNIQFAVPESNRISKVIWLDVDAPSSLLSSEFVPLESINFGTSTDLSLAEVKSFGESYTSIKQLTGKVISNFTKSYTVGTNSGQPLVYQSVPVIPKALFFSDVASLYPALSNNFASYFAAAYLGYRGGMRYMFHSRESSNTDVGAVKPHMWANQLSGPIIGTSYSNGVYNGGVEALSKFYAFTAGNKAIHPNLEVVAPSLLPVDFFPNRVVSTQYINQANFFTTIAKNPTGYDISATIASGTADDGTFVWFLGFPSCYTQLM